MTTTPVPARALITGVAVAGAAALVTRLVTAGRPTTTGLLALAAVTLAVVVADRFTLDLPRGEGGEESEKFMLSDGVWTAALLLAPPGIPTLGAVLGTAVWQLAARWPLRKVAFNVGQVALALSLAEAVFGLGGPGVGGTGHDPLRPTTWLLVAAAMAAAAVVNYGLVAVVITLVQGEPLRAALDGPWRLNAVQWVGNVSVGLLAAVLWRISPAGPVLLAVPVGVLSLAYRDWVRRAIEADQMEQMMRGAQAIARERTFEARLPVGEQPGRLPELAFALNHMLDQLELALHRQRQLMVDVATRLRRPVAALAAAAEGGSARDEADLALVRRVLADMEDLGRSELPGYVDPHPVPVADVVTSIAAKAAPLLDGRLTTTLPLCDTVVRVDQERVEQAVLRLLANTAEHGNGTRPVTLRTVVEERAVRFEVVDEGGGVPAGHEDAIFEPFYSAHPRRDGTATGAGLGLALVRTVAEAHGGSAGVVNRPGAGVTFWLKVPR